MAKLWPRGPEASRPRGLDAAHSVGVRQRPACKTAGIDARTLQRWKTGEGLTAGHGRPQAVRPTPARAFGPEECAALLAVANEPRFAAVPPARIVAMLADGLGTPSTTRQPHSARWPGNTLNWLHICVVTLNPERDEVVSSAAVAPHTQLEAA